MEDYKTWALKGIDAEIAKLTSLRDQLTGVERQETSRKRVPMSEAARKAQSMRMKAVWAAKRKAAKS